MAERIVGELSFVDSLMAEHGRRSSESLERINGLVDWNSVSTKLGHLYPSRHGEKAFPALVMLKVLLLQCWHGLSDPAMEAALDDRLSFRRFSGLSLEDQVPDYATIWRFRQKLADLKLDQVLLQEIERQLDKAGFVMKRGTMIDASLTQSAARRPRINEGKESKTDNDARFGANNERGRFTFGYKMHVAVDEGAVLVRAAVLTPANIQEIDLACDLVRGDEAQVLADRGYDSKRLHNHLAERGIKNGVMRRGQKGKPLEGEALQRNHAISAIRRTVEKVFGTFKRHYQLGRMRYFTHARNQVRFLLSAICYNLRRADVIRAT